MAEMFDSFKEHSIAEFFKKNRHMLGFSGKVRSLTTVIHEYVTNSLDACEEAGILPYIKVEIHSMGDKYKVVVQDNGPGIPRELIGKALGQMLAGTKFHRYMQQRGQQGIGAAGCTMFSLLTTGKPIHVISAHNGTAVSCDVSIDFKTNKPVVKNIVERPATFHGLIIEGFFGDVKFDKGQYGPLEYIKRTAIANPHATIELITPDGEKYLFKRSTDKLPQKPKEVKPHPLGIGPHDLIEFAKASNAKKLSSFLINDFSRVTQKKVNELKELLPDIDFNKDPKALSWQEAERIVKAIHKIKWIAPQTDAVIPIGKEQIEKSLNNVLKPQFVTVVERQPKIYRGGIPFVVEVGIAYGLTDESFPFKGSVMRFANRAPLLFDAAGCAITQAVKSIDWKRYNIQNFDEEPIAVFVNLSSVHVPYVSAGKQAIANEEEIVKEIKNGIMEAARTIKTFIRKRYKAKEIEKKRKALLRYVNRLSEDLAALSGFSQEELKQKLMQLVEERYKLGGG